MRPNSQKKRTNQKGAVVVTAVAVLIIMSILMTATISYVSVNRKKTNENYCHKQAYLTASTTLKGIVKQIELATGKPVPDGTNGEATSVAEQMQNINNLKALAAANGGEGTTEDVKYNGDIETDYRIGTTKINIAQEDGNEDNLVVTAYTTYADVTEQVAAHISMTSKKKPARFTNTIEQIGTQSMYIDNLNVCGDTAILDNTNTTKTYQLTNQLQMQGSLYIWGSVEGVQNNSRFMLQPNLLDNTRGSFIQVSEDFLKYLTVETNVKRGDGYNYVYIGGTCKAAGVCLGVDRNSHSKLGDGYQVDLITHGVDVAGGLSNWYQYGNVYCYDSDPTQNLLTRNGDFKLSGGEKVYIEGDVFIEGNLEIGSGCELNITGDLHVAGSITGSYSVTGGVYQGANAKIEKNGRGSVPTMEYTSEDYKYMPEDFFINRDNMSSGAFASTYEKLSKGTINKEMFRDFGPYVDQDSEYGLNANFHVTESCYIGDYSENLSNVNAFGVKMECQHVVLVDVDDETKDIMIMLKNGTILGTGGRETEIIVRNRSTKKATTLEDGTVTMEHQYNCYFVSDSGTEIKADGETTAGVKKHTGSKPGFFASCFMCIYNYDTFVRMYDSSYYDKTTTINGKKLAARPTSIQNANSKVKPNFVYNPTHDDTITVPGKDVYCPGSSSIIMLIGEGFSFGPAYDAASNSFSSVGQSNSSFIEATVYAPQGYFGMKTQMLHMNIVNSKGQVYDFNNKPVLGCGVFIAKQFASQNESTYVYTEPSGTCVLANAKGSKEANITGFSLDRYDHY